MTSKLFSNWLIAKYNENKASSDLCLWSDIAGMEEDNDPTEAWTITDDITIEETHDRQCTRFIHCVPLSLYLVII